MLNNFIQDERFLGLRWSRLRISICNMRRSEHTVAHPISIIEAIIKTVTRLSRSDYGFEPLICYHFVSDVPIHKIEPNQGIALDILFFQTNSGYVNEWKKNIEIYFKEQGIHTNFCLKEISNVEERSFAQRAAEMAHIQDEGELCLDFITPFPLERAMNNTGKPRTFLSKEEFIKILEKRTARLFGVNIRYKETGRSFTLLPYYWRYKEIKHPSRSESGATQYINGCVGTLYLKGDFRDILPFLILASEIHVGAKLSNAQGFFHLHSDATAYFEKQFPNEKSLQTVIEETMNEDDSALESAISSAGLDHQDADSAKRIARKLRKGEYTFSPYTAFAIPKKDGTSRIVEKSCLDDLIVNRYLLRTIRTVFDRAFEVSSIGYRKGVSRSEATARVKRAFTQGYRFALKSDIDNFFPSINKDKLKALLELYLPFGDRAIKNLLYQSIDAGTLHSGVYFPREKGLSQGSPLSPILANLYLDSFDEAIRDQGIEMLRYADDFIIFTHTREEARAICSRVALLLGDIELSLNQEKTEIVAMDEEFYFLGARFSGREVELDPEESFSQSLKKPLYCVEPYAYLSVSGSAIEIKKYGKIIETIPLHRVNHIMVMGRASLSTALLRKCAMLKIPVAIAMQGGYCVATIKPDSKEYFQRAFLHASRYNALDANEKLFIAKEIAGAKIENYRALFKQKALRGYASIARDMDKAIQSIYGAENTECIRGVEGAASKKIYQHINELILNPDFYMRQRMKRSPDRINSLLNFGSYLLFMHINAGLRVIGLDPYLGFLHSSADNYESLVCDIQELFRAELARFLIRMINLKIITKHDFHESDRGMYLDYGASKIFVEHFEKEMNRRSAPGKLSWREHIYVQLEIMKRWVANQGELSFYKWKL